ncbi:MAG: tryptophan--tRNA ligase [Patescibacteria group bacterium]|nr:tryptophan--tRNA ligase [Patescibacteria group bacterium]
MRYLTGIKPTGDIHIGNYFGAIKPMVESQSDNNELFVFVANYHALTSVNTGADLRRMTNDVLTTYLACGLTHPNTTLYLQSQVPEVHELTWYLSCRATVSELNRAHAYKDAVANGKVPNHGLFAYPVLMAADILMFNPDFVPVGKDQKQHVEFARDWAQSFNNTYSETFKLPEPKIEETLMTIPGTDGRKMSKSYNNVIPLFGTDAQVKKAIMGIVTDSIPVEDPKDPETCNVFAIYKLMASLEEQDALAAKYRAGGMGYGEAKKTLLEKFHEYFGPIREKKQYYEGHKEEVGKLLADSQTRIDREVYKLMNKVIRKVGVDIL